MGKPLTPRVDALEKSLDELAGRQTKLEGIATQLRRDQRDTRKLVRDLSDLVHKIVPNVNEKLDEQTVAINEHVDQQLQEQSRFVVATVVDVARQWPAAAIVAVTAVLGIVGIAAADLLLAAAHLPHLS
jgi:hypothetical protein